jgi:hypothetical protein
MTDYALKIANNALVNIKLNQHNIYPLILKSSAILPMKANIYNIIIITLLFTLQ